MAVANRAFGSDVFTIHISNDAGDDIAYEFAFKNFRLAMSRQRMVSRAAKDRDNIQTGYGWEFGRPKSTEITLEITSIMAGQGDSADMQGLFGNAIGVVGPMIDRAVELVMFGKTFAGFASVSGFGSDFPGEAAEESMTLTFSTFGIS